MISTTIKTILLVILVTLAVIGILALYFFAAILQEKNENNNLSDNGTL